MENEKRLIDANELFAKFERIAKKSAYPYFHLDEIADEINEADAVEVVHGRWMRKEYRGQNDRKTWEWFCSECKTLGSPQWKCCPVCTARMDGDGNGSNSQRKENDHG